MSRSYTKLLQILKKLRRRAKIGKCGVFRLFKTTGERFNVWRMPLLLCIMGITCLRNKWGAMGQSIERPGQAEASERGH
jgi:hypothetical protein